MRKVVFSSLQQQRKGELKHFPRQVSFIHSLTVGTVESSLIDWLVFLGGILYKIHYSFGGGRQVEQGQKEGLSDTQGFCHNQLKKGLLFVARQSAFHLTDVLSNSQ